MDDVPAEENPNNPEIMHWKRMHTDHYFLIKYTNEEERVRFADIVLGLIKYHEIKDFFVEERKAFMESRILYNNHTIGHGTNINYVVVEKRFLYYFAA